MNIDNIRAIQAMMREGRRRAKERGLEFSVRLEDIKWTDYCPIMGVKLERNKGNVQANSPTLDRVNSDYGYIKGNVRIICWRANLLKGNLTLDQAKNLVLYMEGKI